MNKDILKELKKCKSANIPEILETDTEVIIPKYSNIDFIAGLYYNIKIEDYIIDEPDNFTLSSNWNGGTKPPETLLSIKVLEIKGKMVKVDSIGKITGIVWVGWLPKKSITILDRLGD